MFQLITIDKIYLFLLIAKPTCNIFLKYDLVVIRFKIMCVIYHCIKIFLKNSQSKNDHDVFHNVNLNLGLIQ